MNWLACMVGAFVVSCVLTLATNWLALIPWRRTKHLHWTQQARLLWTVRVGAASNLWIVPLNIVLAMWLLWPKLVHTRKLLWLAAWLGGVLGSYMLEREIFAGITWDRWLRQTAGGVMLRWAGWIALFGAVAIMPAVMDWKAWALVAGVVTWYAMLALGGSVWLGCKMGIFVSPPEHLCRLVNETSAKLNVSVRNVWVWKIWIANAFAVTSQGSLIFTERILEILSDDELSAVIAHELGHLSESKITRFMRFVQSLSFVPMIFLNPIVRAWGPAGLCLPIVCIFLMRISARQNRKLESRADQMAVASQAETGIYACALQRIHEYNLIPAVTSRALTHPHLYDRLLAAGVVPDYPRPAAPARAWLSVVYSVLLGVLFVLSANRFAH